MKLVTLKIFTLIVYLLTSKYSYATDVQNIKKLVSLRMYLTAMLIEHHVVEK